MKTLAKLPDDIKEAIKLITEVESHDVELRTSELIMAIELKEKSLGVSTPNVKFPGSSLMKYIPLIEETILDPYFNNLKK